MVSPTSQIRPTIYTGNPTAMNGLNTQSLESIPVASKFKDDTQKTKTSLMVLGGGAAMGPVIGSLIDKASGADGPLIKIAEKISAKTPGLAAKVNGWNLSTKFANLTKPIKNLFKPNNLKVYKEGFSANSGIRKAAEATIKTANQTAAKAGLDSAMAQLLQTAKGQGKDVLARTYEALATTQKMTLGESMKVARQVAKDLGQQDVFKQTLKEGVKQAKQGGLKAKIFGKLGLFKSPGQQIETAKRTLDTLKKSQALESAGKMNMFGKAFTKTGLFFKKNLTGLTGMINGLFAAMTINSVIQAKKGEKVSTFMEDVLGTWVGSLYGFQLTQKVLNGLSKVYNNPNASKGILSTVAKVVNKVPGKGFVVPLAGAMLLSTVLQKVSHKIFGKPTKEEPKTIESVEDFNSWMKNMGWSAAEIKQIQKQQALNAANNPQVTVNNTPAAGLNQDNNGGYQGYMPSSEVAPAILEADQIHFASVNNKVDKDLQSIQDTLKLVDVKI